MLLWVLQVFAGFSQVWRSPNKEIEGLWWTHWKKLNKLEKKRNKNEQTNSLLLYFFFWFGHLAWAPKNQGGETSGILPGSRKPCVVFISSPNAGLGRFHNGPSGMKTYENYMVLVLCVHSISYGHMVCRSHPRKTDENWRNRKELEEHCRRVKENQRCL